MVSLKAWMRREIVSDSDMAEQIGAFSAEGVRKLRFGVRGASSRVTARIFAITGGEVGPPDLVPPDRRPLPERTRPCP